MGPLLSPRDDPAEGFVTSQQTIERLQLCESLCGQGAPLMLAHKASEPLAQAPRLIGDGVEFARKRAHPHVLEDIPGARSACSSHPR